MTSTFFFIIVNAKRGKSNADSQERTDRAKSLISGEALARP
jgi:hypothetical protein